MFGAGLGLYVRILGQSLFAFGAWSQLGASGGSKFVSRPQTPDS